MADDLPDWPRPYYQGPGGRPFLFYAVYGAFGELPALSRKEYRSAGMPRGLDLSHYDAAEHPGVLDGFREGYLWDHLKEQDPDLARRVLDAKECLILRGELDDQADLNYFRDAVGLLTFLVDQGGLTVYD